MEDRAGIQASELKDLQEFRSGETIRKKESFKKKKDGKNPKNLVK